jgi:NADP-dependent 3-hydroxy acid dehydrogenase YdfG
LDVVAEGKDQDWEAMLQSNVLGVLRVTRAALPLIPKDCGSSIINIGSVAGMSPMKAAPLIAPPKPASFKSPEPCAWN